MRTLERLFYAPAQFRGVLVTRTIVALHALWIALSRPCLPDLAGWPHEFWAAVAPQTLARYVWFGGAIEWPLWIALLIFLALAPVSRAAALGSSLLLYHFAPLEDVMIGSPGPFARGLTVDVLALGILAFTPRLRAPPGGDFRWPVFLVRFLVASQYAFSTVAKLRTAGLRWFSGANIQDLARTFDALGVAPYPGVVIDHPALAAVTGVAWLILSLAMIVTPFSPRVAFVVVPLMLIAHAAAIAIFGIVWLAAPLLLVFLPWDQSVTPNSSAHRASE